jgi:hypothetical protein
MVDGFEHVVAGCKAGKGVIAALPHVGGWDYGGAWLAVHGYPPTVVVEPVEPPELFEWFADTRRRLGMDVVPLGPDAGRGVLRALRANRVVCLLCDRDIAGDGVEVEFFGERTTLPAARAPNRRAAPSGRGLLPAPRWAPGLGAGAGAGRATRSSARRRCPRHAGAGRPVRAADPEGAGAVAPPATELAQRPVRRARVRTHG